VKYTSHCGRPTGRNQWQPEPRRHDGERPCSFSSVTTAAIGRLRIHHGSTGVNRRQGRFRGCSAQTNGSHHAPGNPQLPIESANGSGASGGRGSTGQREEGSPGKTWGRCPQTPGIFRFAARIPGQRVRFCSHPPNPGRWVGARGASPQSSILRPGCISISNRNNWKPRKNTRTAKNIGKSASAS
jgi:hypothetical protein